MKKFYYIIPLAPGIPPNTKTGYFADTLEDAAKRVATLKTQNERSGMKYDYIITEAVKVAKQPEPQPVELVDLD